MISHSKQKRGSGENRFLFLCCWGKPQQGRAPSHTDFRSMMEQWMISRTGAVAVILFILIAMFTAILFATSRSWIFYEGDDRE